MKKCPLCKKFKTREEFGTTRAQTAKAVCLKCEYARHKHGPKRHVTHSTFGLTREVYEALRTRLYRYKLSVQLFLDMVASQEGKCAICQDSYDHSLYVDHCHKEDTVRGLLCVKCNTGLGFFEDDPERLAAAMKYLLDHKVPTSRPNDST